MYVHKHRNTRIFMRFDSSAVSKSAPIQSDLFLEHLMCICAFPIYKCNDYAKCTHTHTHTHNICTQNDLSVHMNDVWRHTCISQHTATHCNTVQHTATHCNTLQHTATHCNTLQHTATHCNTPHMYRMQQ